MNKAEPESGFVGAAESDGFVDTVMTDVEIVRTTATNVIARGRRYGRMWLLKGLRRDLRDSTQASRQLMKEFEIHSRLSHPGVVRAIGFEEISGLGRCIVEEWVDGKTLADLLREGALTSGERRRLVRQIVATVAYLHTRGVVHRDLKPSNIMVRAAGGEPVLIDFGLADTDDYVELKLPAGTEGFISPEQRESGGAHTSDDIYSLGVIIREMCPRYAGIARRCTGAAGRRPGDARALLSMIERRDRRPRIFGALMVLIATVALFGAAGARISSLDRSSQEARARVALLTDSLSEVRLQLRQIEEYDSLLQSVGKEGQRLIDSVLIAYDRKVFAPMAPDRAERFSDEVTNLLKDLRRTTETYCATLDSCGLQPHDLEKMRLDLCNYYTITMADYHNRWIKKLYPQLAPTP